MTNKEIGEMSEIEKRMNLKQMMLDKLNKDLGNVNIDIAKVTKLDNGSYELDLSELYKDCLLFPNTYDFRKDIRDLVEEFDIDDYIESNNIKDVNEIDASGIFLASGISDVLEQLDYHCYLCLEDLPEQLYNSLKIEDLCKDITKTNDYYKIFKEVFDDKIKPMMVLHTPADYESLLTENIEEVAEMFNNIYDKVNEQNRNKKDDGRNQI